MAILERIATNLRRTLVLYKLGNAGYRAIRIQALTGTVAATRPSR